MLPAKRQAQILEHLRDQRFASLQAIADLTRASLSTARRDVDELCEQGHLERTHGGAALRENEHIALEVGPAVSQEMARAEKWQIGRLACRDVAAHDSILLDSGSTTLAVAHALVERQLPLTVFTNDLSIAGVLAQVSRITVHMPPGTVRTGSATLLGSACYRMLASLRVNTAFLGAHAVCMAGASEASLEYGEIKRVMMEAADRCVLVADSSKFGERARTLFAPLDAFDALVTDARLDRAMQQELADAGVALEIAS